MQRFIWVLGGLAPGIVAGFALGGVSPRMEIEATTAEIESLEAKLKKAQRRGGSSSPLGMLPFLQQASEPTPAARVPAAGEADEASAETPGGRPRRTDRSPPRRRFYKDQGEELDGPGVRGRSNRAAADSPGTSSARANLDDLSPEEQRSERRRRFQAAVDVQRVRAQQSLAALQQSASLGPVQMEEVGTVITDMNERLRTYSENLAAIAESEAEPPPGELLYLTRELSSVLYDSQTELEATIGEEAVATAESESTQIWNYIDLEAFADSAEAFADGRAGDDGQAAAIQARLEELRAADADGAADEATPTGEDTGAQ